MIQICHSDKKRVLNAIRSGHIDAADLSFPNLIDSIVLTMKQHGFLLPLTDFLADKRRDNSHIPFGILIVLAIVAKLKWKTSLTDVTFAVNDAELLAELGWNVWDYGRDIKEGLFSEGVMRKLLAKYSNEEWVDLYNHYVQESLI